MNIDESISQEKIKVSWLNLFTILSGIIFIALSSFKTISSPQFWSHLAYTKFNGFITEGLYAQSINSSILYDLFLINIWNIFGGENGSAILIISLLNIIAILTGFFFLLKITNKYGKTISKSLALLASGIILFPSIDVGPESIMFLMLSIFIYFISNRIKKNKHYILLILLQIIWANLHYSFIFGFLLYAIFLISKLIQKQVVNRTDIIIPIILFLSSIINFNGIYAINQSFSLLTEIILPFSNTLFSASYKTSSVSLWVLIIMIVNALGLILFKKKLPIFLTIIAIIGNFINYGYASLFTVALFFPFFVISIQSIIDFIISQFSKSANKKNKIYSSLIKSLLIIIFIISVIPIITSSAHSKLANGSRFGVGISDYFADRQFPKEINFLLSDEKNTIINHPDDGGFISYQFNRKCFLDYRDFGSSLHLELKGILSGNDESYSNFIRKYQPDIFFLNCLMPETGKGVAELLKTGLWKILYFDGINIILGKKDFEDYNQGLDLGLAKLNNFKNYYTGEGGRIYKESDRRLPLPLIGAGNIYLHLSNELSARRSAVVAKHLFEIVLENYQNILEIQINLGYTELILGNIDSALEIFTSIINSSNLQKDSIFQKLDTEYKAWNGYKYVNEIKGNKEEVVRAEEKINSIKENTFTKNDKIKINNTISLDSFTID